MKITMKIFIGNLLFLSILMLLSTRILSVISGTPFPIDIVTSDSMSPTLMEGDIVAWTTTDINDVKTGDVIVFKSWISWPDERLVLHRVVDVKQAWGKTALITKGDANKYPDQSGPHIPEPYVTDRNFLGKAITIGNIPLKIPLIGNIGIWLNKGFEFLARPSEPKDSISYVGIFTPLTISVIFLIVGVFILPEKQKTNKEKIRFNILGSHPLNLKKTFASFLVIYILFLFVIHAFAYDTNNASVGVGEFPEKGYFQLGSVEPGTTSFSRDLPVFNSGIMPVKGIIFGQGKLNQFLDRSAFKIESGESISVPITVSAPLEIENGIYNGKIMVYSSPFWYMFPDEFIQNLCSWHGAGSLYLLDLLSACILTVLTVGTIILTSFFNQKYIDISIDLSWRFAPKLFLKKGILTVVKSIKKRITSGLDGRFGWIKNIELGVTDIKKPISASLIVIPALLLCNSELLAMVIASITAGIIAFIISCKMRKKIILTCVISSTIIITYSILKTFFYLVFNNLEVVELIALSMGTLGVYILVFAALLIPICLVSWWITRSIRNLKEQKDVFILLEGSCDL